MSDEGSARKRPAPLACQECRNKHIKCDGASPACGRCSSLGHRCRYVPSRRGIYARMQPRHLSRDITTPSVNVGAASPGTSALNAPSTSTSGPSFTRTSPGTDNLNVDLHSLLSSTQQSHLVGLYYSHFHPSHPMLVPYSHFDAQEYPDYLVLATCLAGQHFSANSPSIATLRVAVALVSAQHESLALHRIQALLLFTLVFMGVENMGHADECIAQAASLAHNSDLRSTDTNLSMSVSSPSQSVKEESLRRTWWELYTVDALLALLRHRSPAFPYTTNHRMPHLPRAEELYDSDQLANAQLIPYADLELRTLAIPMHQISSYACRIEATDIVRRVCLLFIGQESDLDAMETISDLIAAWNFNLSAASFTSPNLPGMVDNLLLQAHLLVQVAALFLYFPRSDLSVSAPAPVELTCIGKRTQAVESSGQHTLRAIAASKTLCHLATFPWLHAGNSPFMICGMVLGAAVQISAASCVQDRAPKSQFHNHRRKVVLMLTALEAIGKVWPLCLEILGIFRPIAGSVFDMSQGVQRTNDRMNAPDSGIVIEEGCSGQSRNQEDSGLNLFDASFHNMDWTDFFASFDGANGLPP